MTDDANATPVCKFCGAKLIFRGQTTCQSCGGNQASDKPPADWKSSEAWSLPASLDRTGRQRPTASPSASGALPASTSLPASTPFPTSAPYAVPSAPYAVPSAPYAVPSAPYAVPSAPPAAPSWHAPTNPPGQYAAPPWQPPTTPSGLPSPASIQERSDVWVPSYVGRHTFSRIMAIVVALAVGLGTASCAFSIFGRFALGSGGFRTVGPMMEGRANHTATLLADSRVLIAGGAGFGDDVLLSAEVFNPDNGVFSPTGSMSTPRMFAAAVRLNDDRVLVAGGRTVDSTSTPSLASTEIYDPTTWTFSPAAPMGEARQKFTATLLLDGQVLLAGGEGSEGELSSAELFDSSTGQFTTVGPMVTARANHTATLLHDGKVLIAGGWTSDGATADAEIYDPTTRAFSATGALHHARYNQAANMLPDGRVLLAGGLAGTDGEMILSSSEIYDPATRAFTDGAAMDTRRSDSATGVLPSGKVLFAGGVGDGPNLDNAYALSSAELYDPSSGAFSGIDEMGYAAVEPAATMLADGRLLITGGWESSEPLDNAEVYRE